MNTDKKKATAGEKRWDQNELRDDRYQLEQLALEILRSVILFSEISLSFIGVYLCSSVVPFRCGSIHAPERA
jgi:hypothetical protein